MSTFPATTTTSLPEELEALVEGAGMTAEGRAAFLGATPRIEDPATFDVSCAGLKTGEEGRAHTHGCVADGVIHLRQIGDPEIADLINVVAAHELLHVVYGTLESSEREAIDAELEKLRARNAALRERLKAYDDGEDLENELHSVAGSEFADLSVALEDHYGRYFDRAKVLGAYQAALGDRDREIRRLRATVAELDARVDTARLNLEQLETAGDVEAFNAAVDPFNALVAERNRSATLLNDLVEEYNRLIGS